MFIIPFLILVMALTDIAGCQLAGLHFTGFTKPFLTCLALSPIALFYTFLRPSKIIVESILYVQAWVLFSVFGAIQSYLVCTLGWPAIDNTLITLDRLAGFDWQAFFGFVRSHSILYNLLALFYSTLLIQIIINILIFSFSGDKKRNKGMLLSSIIAIFITSFIVLIFPSLGPFYSFGYYSSGVPGSHYVYTILALRDGVAPHALSLDHMEGVYSFPSYHVVLAIIFTYYNHNLRSFYPFAAVNCIMAISTIPIGGHYLMDILGGALVACIAIPLAHKLT
ncbi:phosphatase PAP2 family protein [Acetobacter fabarum]|uniref:phosphatase PAP2 family protein n=1 Tax=Acetobacter fabarum TaxID=483199 RepID=UPI00312B6DF7